MSNKKWHNVNEILNRAKIALNTDSDAKLAARLEVDPSTISTWRSRNTLNFERLLTKCNDINANWLLYGRGSQDVMEQPKFDSLIREDFGGRTNYIVRGVPSISEDEEFYKLPFYASVKASAGGGLIPQDRKPLEIAFRKYFINKSLKTQAKDLFAMMVAGDSMEPALFHNDLILIDRSKRTPRAGNIMVTRIDETLSCKRIQELPGNRFRIMSDNEAYESFEVSVQEKGFEIIGTVIWFGRSI